MIRATNSLPGSLPIGIKTYANVNYKIHFFFTKQKFFLIWYQSSIDNLVFLHIMLSRRYHGIKERLPLGKMTYLFSEEIQNVKEYQRVVDIGLRRATLGNSGRQIPGIFWRTA